ncbi:amino acid permease [Lichenifustis flavocetrariae]|uniref:Amino acid permease n=1 Tax=Lichenifustis flavocetrariae TaxID=2949735 RepID=A0AA42CGK5_9HYPH|nr:amino acid permease [Lichenifustis flavocetrariae]MCW6506678.1 amino acid permease [Lichenifustis flavocetrariae]
MGVLQRVFERKPIGPEADHGLGRTLTVADLVTLGIGATVGAGLFSLTGIAAADFAGPAVVISFAIAAVGCALTGLCYSELAGMIPSSGSAYAYAYAALGEVVAWIIGWDLLMEYAIGAGTVASSWSSYVRSLLHGWGWDLPHWFTAVPSAGGLIDLPAAAIIVMLSLLLIAGIRESTRVNAIFVVLKVAVVLVVTGLGAFYVNPANYHPFVPDNTGQFGSFGWSGVLRGAGVVFFAYLGFDAVSTTAAEAEEPQRSVPIGILGSLVICTLLYMAFAVVLTGMVNYQKMHGDAAPVATAIERTPFLWLQVTVKLGVILGFTSVLLVGLLGQARVMFAMARDGMLPAVLGRLHPGRKTPWVAHLTMMGLTVLLAGFVPVEALSKLTSVGTLLAFAIVCGGVLVLRVREPERPRPFRVPWSPFVPALGIVTCLGMMVFLPWQTWLRLGGWLALGLVAYGLYSHRRATSVRAAAANQGPGAS